MSKDLLTARFGGRKLLIATKHQKEKVIAPLLEEALGVKCFIDPAFDSDQFGTFSGEVEREADPLSTLRKKCRAAAAANSCDLVVGSEGSFGPHPVIGMIPADEEWIMLIDLKDNLEIVSRTLSTDTNFNSTTIRDKNELLDFANRVKFPEHGLILRAQPQNTTGIQKGIIDQSTLLATYDQLQSQYGSTCAETDMRACFNPTRMGVIKSVTEKLIRTIQSVCPHCQTPGFDVVEVISGLPCSQCGLRTRSIRQHRYECKHCHQTEFRNFPHGKEQEDPMYCDFCNP